MAGKIMYCIMPTRFLSDPYGPEHIERIREKVRSWGYAPTIPFDAGPYRDFEGGSLGREGTLKFMLKYQAICDASGVFGISAGAMNELKQAIQTGQELRIDLSFDPEWYLYYKNMQPEFGDLLAQVRGPHHLIALVGPTAIGKTYWMNWLLNTLPSKIRRVKNTTTRRLREHNREEEMSSYNFVARDFFESQIKAGAFAEHDSFRGEYYGSNMKDIRAILKDSSGIFALTPKGASALYARRYEINLTIILLVPANRHVLINNLRRRQVPKSQWLDQLRTVEQFVLPPEIEHRRMVITGTKEDGEKISSIIEQLI
ncbi:MAG: hypothetical protein Q7S32_00240 [bacterium]|nr:hypothetical protein [bacterium]